MYNFVVKSVYGFIQTTRLIKAFAVGTILAAASGSILYGIGVLFFLTFSFTFNDWVDAPKDNVGHPNRAIPSGKITRPQAFYISLALLLIGVGWSILFLPAFSPMFAFIYLLSILYSFFLKPNIPILATPVWSLAIAILFVQPFSGNITMYLAVASFVFAYEMLLDYRDRKADKEFCATPTLANILGKYTLIISVLAFFAGTALLIYA